MSAPRRDPERRGPRAIHAGVLSTLARCERLLWLDTHAPGEGAPETDFVRDLRERGIAHERWVREQFTGLIGPLHGRGRPTAESAAETLRLLRESRAPLYQPVFVSADGAQVGVPDFVYWEDEQPVVRDAKLAQNVDGRRDIQLQLTHYAHLLEAASGLVVRRLEVTNGRGEEREIRRLDSESYRAAVERARAILGSGTEPTLLKSHSACEACAFYAHCWDRAEAEGRIEAIAGMHSKFVPLLAARGIRDAATLAAADPPSLEVRGMGSQGPPLAYQARALTSGVAAWLGPLPLPETTTRVWFDLEADPEDEHGQISVYLWGIAVDRGAGPPVFEPLFAMGDDAGGWRRFVERATEILDAYPDAVWIHYDHYERVWVEKYVQRHGAPEGFLRRLLRAMFDLRNGALMPAARLPLRSYSIKHVAPWMGFEWRDPESGSQWSVVQYTRARRAKDPAERAALLDAIARYNEDDLLAMRAVWEWLEAHAPQRTPARPGPAPKRRARRPRRRRERP